MMLFREWLEEEVRLKLKQYMNQFRHMLQYNKTTNANIIWYAASLAQISIEYIYGQSKHMADIMGYRNQLCHSIKGRDQSPPLLIDFYRFWKGEVEPLLIKQGLPLSQC